MPSRIDIRKRYEQLFPMTTWSDEEILDYLHKQESTILNESTDSSIEIIKVDSLEEYMKANNCCYLEEFIATLRNRIK